MKLTPNNLFITIHNAFATVDSDSSFSVKIQNYTHVMCMTDAVTSHNIYFYFSNTLYKHIPFKPITDTG